MRGACGEQFWRTIHVPHTRHAVGEQQREHGLGVGRSQRMRVHVVVAGHHEFSPRIDGAHRGVCGGCRDGNDAADAPALQQDAHVRRQCAGERVHDGDTLEPQRVGVGHVVRRGGGLGGRRRDHRALAAPGDRERQAGHGGCDSEKHSGHGQSLFAHDIQIRLKV